MTTVSGALNPMPKPSVRRSYAWRCVVWAGASPAAGNAVWIDSAGAASAASTATAPRR